MSDTDRIVNAINGLRNTLGLIAFWLFLMLVFKDMSSNCNCNKIEKNVPKIEHNISIENNSTDDNNTLPRV